MSWMTTLCVYMCDPSAEFRDPPQVSLVKQARYTRMYSDSESESLTNGQFDIAFLIAK
jgi:hypothetical protein